MITSKHLDGTGNVHLWDLGPTKVRMAAVDARHAVETEPERWALVDPNSPDKYEPAERSASEFGGDGVVELPPPSEPPIVTAYHPEPTDERSESEKGSG